MNPAKQTTTVYAAFSGNMNKMESHVVDDWKHFWSERTVAIIKYIMCGDTREGTALHSAQWTMLEHLFCILKPFMITVKEVRALAAPMNQVKSPYSSVC